MRKEEYLDIVQEQIRCKLARDGVRRELEGHIEDQMGCYRAQGIASHEAEEMAVRDMGDPVETGNAMDRIHRPKMAWKSIGVIIGLGLVTFLLQYIMGNSDPDHTIYAGTWIPGGAPRYLLIQIAGWGMMVGVCYLDYTRIGKYAPRLMLLGCIVVLLLEVFAMPVNGVNYWIFVGTSVSVRMLLFLFLPLYGAALYRYRGQGYRGIAAGVLWMLPSFLVMLREKAVIVGMIIGLTYLVVLSTAIWKDWFAVSKKAAIIVLWIAASLFWYLGFNGIRHWGAPYQVSRLQVIEECLYGTGAMHPALEIRKLISGSRFLGTKEGFLADSDGIADIGSYTLSLICAYYGVFVAVVLVAGILLLFLYFVRMSLRQKNQLGMIMGTGCSVVFLVELLLYIMGNIGRLPGISCCPFLGYGGTGIVVNYILMGILLSVYRYEHVASEIRFKKLRYVRQKEM